SCWCGGMSGCRKSIARRSSSATTSGVLGYRVLAAPAEAPQPTGEPTRYAFGLNVGEHRGLKTVWHTGAFPGFRTAHVPFPGKRFSVIILANLGGPKGINAAVAIRDIRLGHPCPSANDRSDHSFLTGTYRARKKATRSFFSSSPSFSSSTRLK